MQYKITTAIQVSIPTMFYIKTKKIDLITKKKKRRNINMPNWTDNRIIIRGKHENLEKLLDKMKYDPEKAEQLAEVSSYRLCNAKPTPDALSELKHGNKEINGKQYQVWIDIKDNKTNEYVSKPVPDETKQYLIDKYQTISWYDWQVMNWGTKWGDIDTEFLNIMEYQEASEDYLVFQFRTPWGQPYRLLDYIATEYDVSIECSFTNEGEWDDEGNIPLHENTYPATKDERKSMSHTEKLYQDFKEQLEKDIVT